MPLVINSMSPSRAPPLGLMRSAVATPTIVPATTIRETAGVISVCPPAATAPTSRQAAATSPANSRSRASSVPGGARSEERNHRGSPPVAATSFAFTTTACRPGSAAGKVIGSAARTIRSASPTAATAASSPFAGPSSSPLPSGPGNRASRSRMASRTRGGAFPSGSSPEPSAAIAGRIAGPADDANGPTGGAVGLTSGSK